MTKKELVKAIAYLLKKPTIFNWRDNGTSEEFIRGYCLALEDLANYININRVLLKKWLEEEETKIHSE